MSSILSSVIKTVSLPSDAVDADNFDAPNAVLNGRLVYQGETIYVEQDQVSYELWQSGFGQYAPIKSFFSQDGTYSASLFNRTYKLVIPTSQEPFKWKTLQNGTADSIVIVLNGSQTLDLEVTPYYLIKNTNLSSAGRKISGTIRLEKIITGADGREIEFVSLYVNKTQFVSGNSNANIANTRINASAIGSLANRNISVDVPAITPSPNYVFA